MDMKNSDSVNLVIQGSNGQQQMLKIMRNPNGQPLTQEGVAAIVKEYMNSSNSDKFEKFRSTTTDATVLTMPVTNVIASTVSSASPAMANGRSAPPATISSAVASTASAANAAGPNVYHKTVHPPANQPPTTANNVQRLANGTRLIAVTTGHATTTAVASGGQFKMAAPAPTNVKYVSIKAPTAIPHGLTASKSQPSSATGSPSVPPKKTRRRKTDRVGKGLRHFSMKVCEKVKEKGTTTYNEVADELVEEFCSQEAHGQPVDPASYDQKNIRRRVYDALNVLMAMNIISKDKKEIRWIGLPTNSAQQCSTLETENRQRQKRIEAKQRQLRELILQQVSFKSLVTRNKESEERGIVPSASSAIQMPFIIVNTHKKTHVNCSISNDKSEYQFKFDDTFEIHDDIEVLKRMGLLLGLDTGDCSFEDIERAKTMVPKSFEKYIEMYGRGQTDDCMPYDDDTMFNEDSIILKTEQMSDEEELDDDHYSDMSDME